MAARNVIWKPTVDRLEAVGGGPEGSRGFLEIGSPPLGIAMLRDDHFIGDTLDANVYQYANNGTAAADPAVSAGALNGVILLNPGTDADGYSALSMGRHCRGDHNATIWWRVSMNPTAMTSTKFELGFTDVVAGTDAGAVNVKATPTFRADDCVCWVYDTNDDQLLTLVGNKATVAATPIDVTAATFTPVINGVYWFGITLKGDRAKGFILDANTKLIAETAWMEDAVTESVLLTPWAFAQNRAASQRYLVVDRLKVYQRESTG